MFRGPQFIGIKAYAGHKLLKKLLKYALFDQNSYYSAIFFKCSRATQMHLTGHMRPVFETSFLKRLRATVGKQAVYCAVFLSLKVVFDLDWAPFSFTWSSR
jgi:hypothetical protein